MASKIKPLKKGARESGAPPSPTRDAKKQKKGTSDGPRGKPGKSQRGLLDSPARKLTAGLLVTGLIVLLGCIVWPSVFWEQFVFRYFWGSTEADAVGHPVNGVTEDYNLISTAVYGILLACAVYLIHHEFNKRKIVIDFRYIMALIPWVFFGTLTRALEDSGYFTIPTSYFFIAPQIYIVVGVMVVALTLLGSSTWWRDHASNKPGKTPQPTGYLLMILGVFTAFVGEAFVVGSGDNDLVWHFNAVMVSSFVTVYIVIIWKGVAMDVPNTLFYFGLTAVASPLFLVLYWCAYPGAWGPLHAHQLVLHPIEGLVIPGLALLVTLLVAIIFYWLGKQWKKLKPLSSGMSTLIIFGHMLDAAATYRALDFYSYGEKHVLPNFLIEASGTGLVMFPLKGIAMGFVLYVLEVEFRKDLAGQPLLRGLLRAALLILGLSPGLRDMFRLVMGV